MSKNDKIHAVFLASSGKPERLTLCGRDAETIIGALQTHDPATVTCGRCRDSRRWAHFFSTALFRKPA